MSTTVAQQTSTHTAPQVGVRPSVVIIEDEPDILEVLEYNLTREGFDVRTALDGHRGLAEIRRDPPELVLLDLMLPGVDGLEVCRQLRSDRHTRGTRIVMLTAKGEEADLVIGLGMGADDYISKPFSLRELVARIKAVLRRGALRGGDEVEVATLTRGPLSIDPSRHEVTVAGESVTLTATEFRLLHLLADHPGRVFARDQLLDRVMGENAPVMDRTIDAHIRTIRKKLRAHRDLIETIRGVGYRFRD